MCDEIVRERRRRGWRRRRAVASKRDRRGGRHVGESIKRDGRDGPATDTNQAIAASRHETQLQQW